MYVASSRTGDPDALKFAVMQQPGEPLSATANFVFKEVLLTDSLTESEFDEFYEDDDVIFEDQIEDDENCVTSSILFSKITFLPTPELAGIHTILYFIVSYCINYIIL